MSRYKLLHNGATDCECPRDFIHGHSQGDVVADEAQVAKLAARIAELERLGDALLSDLSDSGWGDGSLVSIEAWRKARGAE